MPQLLLRRFADEHGQLQQWRNGEIRLVGIRDVTVRQDFYAMADATGAPRNLAVDQFLWNVENDAAPVIDRVLSSGKLPGPASSSRTKLAWFVACQAARSVRQRRQFEVVSEAVLRIQLSRSTRAEATRLLEESGQLRTPSFEKFRAGEIGLDGLEVELDPDLHVGLVLPAQAEQTYQIIRHRPWQLWSVSEPLITSDDPVCLAPDPQAAPDAALGVSTAMSVLIPLDRWRALVIQRPDAAEGRLFVTDPLYASTPRELVMACADRELYAHPDDDLSFVRRDDVGAFVGPLMVEQAGGDPRLMPTVDGLNGPMTRLEPRRRRRRASRF